MLADVLGDAAGSPIIEASPEPCRAFLDVASAVLLEAVRSASLAAGAGSAQQPAEGCGDGRVPVRSGPVGVE